MKEQIEVDVDELREVFVEKFGADPLLFKSPGRINLIGEHTDYNDGFVMPAAIDKAAYVAIAKTDDERCELVALDINETYEFNMSDKLSPVEAGWVNYFLGVIDQFLQRGFILGGFKMIFTSDVPLGAGLSSSAALESVFGYALSQLFEIEVSRVELARIGQAAEHTYAGVKCGIMDQYASCLGKKDHAVLIDCRSLEHTYIPCDLGEYQPLLFDSCVKHNLADTEYNVRRQQCEEGVTALAKVYPEVKSLRDANLEQLESVRQELSPVVYSRCKYVIEEKTRVEKAAEALKNQDIATLGSLMNETHVGLSQDYEVSCSELDVLYDIARANPHILGARMMGGGFGGCTINIVKTDKIDEVVQSVEDHYKTKVGKSLKHYCVRISDGATKL